jgi:hypothetical protein
MIALFSFLVSAPTANETRVYILCFCEYDRAINLKYMPLYATTGNRFASTCSHIFFNLDNECGSVEED